MYRTGKQGLKNIYVVGCGPSLANFDWSLLGNKTTIAVNGAIHDVPNPDFFLTADSSFARKASNAGFWGVETYKILVMASNHKHFRFVKPFLYLWNHRISPRRFDGQIGFSEDEFCTGQNSGFCGMQLAVILGAEKIHLLGMDFHRGNLTNYHGRYVSYLKTLNEFFIHFKTAINILRGKGIKIVNHSPTSRLNEILPHEALENG